MSRDAGSGPSTVPATGTDPGAATAHLRPETWAEASRDLVAKALAEFAHERLLDPEPVGAGRYVVRSDDGQTGYEFAARRLLLDHWQVEPASIRRIQAGRQRRLDALELILDIAGSLGLTERVLPVYLEEITSTLASRAFRLARPAPPAADLARAGFQAIEAAMAEGHPCFVANSGRLGFDAAEYHTYAPEAGARVRLLWLAARRERSAFSHASDLRYDDLLRAELGPHILARFAGVLAGRGLDLGEVHLIPVHPWQWWNRLAVTFAPDLAWGDLVLLGQGDDEYQPQQAIRTFFNITDPTRHYVKMALSVLNMGFVRGLSAEYMAATPAINEWVHDVVTADPVLRRAGFAILRERAAVGYRQPQYRRAAPAGSPYRKLLAALWRESPVPRLRRGERLTTMAALLHVDRAGASVAGALIEESGLAPERWLRHYLDAYLVPVVHCCYAYDLAFMPHGENVILVLDARGVPRRAFLKDIGEEVTLMNSGTPLPAGVERIRAPVPDELKLLAVFTDAFDCFFRFLAAILDREGVLDQDRFWTVVAACARDYQRSAPELAARFARHDLFADRFPLSCLNRLQLRDNQQLVDLADPAAALQLVGTLDNPIAR